MKYTLKHRLIGAAVLAAIAVLFLPSFFKEKQVAPVSTKTMIPQRPGTIPVEFNAPQPVPGIEPAPEPEAMFAPDGVPPNEPSAVVNATTHQASSVSTVKESTAKEVSSSPVNSMPLNAQGLPDAWVVQVGSFATKEAANKVKDDLQADGFKAYVRSVPSSSGMISRVYIGPKLDKAQAQLIKGQVDKRLKVNSIITHFQP